MEVVTLVLFSFFLVYFNGIDLFCVHFGVGFWVVEPEYELAFREFYYKFQTVIEGFCKDLTRLARYAYSSVVVTINFFFCLLLNETPYVSFRFVFLS